jgi:hypothetical protein
MGMFYSCPRQETVEIVESFGRFSKVAYPGTSCMAPSDTWSMLQPIS